MALDMEGHLFSFVCTYVLYQWLRTCNRFIFIIQLYFYDNISEYMFFMPAKKKRGTFRRCGVLKLYTFVICRTFPITPQANVVQSLPFPKFFCLACRRRWISLSQGLSTLDVKNTEKIMPNWASNPVLVQQETVQALQHSATTGVG